MHLFRNDNNKSKSRTSRLLSVALSAALALGSFSAMAFANSDNTVASKDFVAENTASAAVKTQEPAAITPTPTPERCGINAYFILKDNGELIITTTGDAEIPYTEWANNRTGIIRSIHIITDPTHKVTFLGTPFARCNALESVTIDKSAEVSFPDYSFMFCDSLKTMNILSSKVSFGEDCFLPWGDDITADIYLPNILSPDDFSLISNLDGTYGSLNFHFSDQSVVDALSGEPSANVGNYICENGSVITPEPEKDGGVSFSVASNGSIFYLVMKLEELPSGGFGGYRVKIGESEEWVTIPDDGIFEFPCEAKEMTDEFRIFVDLHYSNPDTGIFTEEEFVNDTVSVADCLKAILNYESASEDAKSVAKKMLCYGAAVQAYFLDQSANLVNDGVIGAQFDDLSNLPDTLGTYDGTSLDFSLHFDYSDYAGITLRFRNELEFYMFFKVKDNCTSAQASQELFSRYTLTGVDKLEKEAKNLALL